MATVAITLYDAAGYRFLFSDTFSKPVNRPERYDGFRYAIDNHRWLSGYTPRLTNNLVDIAISKN
jgi:hypothetical protein